MLTRRIFMVAIATFCLMGAGVCDASEIPLNLSGASIAATGAETFRISNTTIPGVEGTYWVDFQWNPVTLVFAPVAAGVEETATNGLLACVAYHAEATGNELMSTIGSFQLSNLDDHATITIDRVLVYDMSGTLLCEGPTGWDPFGTMIGPNGGTWFSTARLATWCPDLPEVTWVIVKVYWSSPGSGSVFPLYGSSTEVTRDLNTNLIVGRSSVRCETVY